MKIQPRIHVSIQYLTTKNAFMKKLIQLLMTCIIFAGCSLKKDKVQPPEEMVNGIVVEYGTRNPIEGVQFVHADCKKHGFGGCVDWEYTTPVFSNQDGTFQAST